MGEVGGRGMRGVEKRKGKAENDVIIFYLKLKINLYVLKKKLIHRPTSNYNLFCHFISNIISGP